MNDTNKFEFVRILDPDDPYHRRLGLVLDQDSNQVGLWISGQPATFRHWVARASVVNVPGTWHDIPGRGAVFVVDGGQN